MRGEVSACALGAGNSVKDVESYRIKILRKRAPADGRDGDGLLNTQSIVRRIYVALSTAACEMSCSRLGHPNITVIRIINFERDEENQNTLHTRGGCAPVGEYSPREAMHKRSLLSSFVLFLAESCIRASTRKQPWGRRARTRASNRSNLRWRCASTILAWTAWRFARASERR